MFSSKQFSQTKKKLMNYRLKSVFSFFLILNCKLRGQRPIPGSFTYNWKRTKIILVVIDQRSSLFYWVCVFNLAPRQFQTWGFLLLGITRIFRLQFGIRPVRTTWLHINFRFRLQFFYSQTEICSGFYAQISFCNSSTSTDNPVCKIAW